MGVEFFERRKKWVPLDDAIVRENLRRLRNLLQAYYAEEGIEDRLNLELRGFKPVFSYNVRNPVERNFRRALRYLSTDPNVAFSLLDETLSVEPDHAEAFAARAEAELWRPMYGNEIEIPDLLEAAESQAQESLRYDDKCWRAHVVMGALHCSRKKWDKAADSFSLALKSSPAATSAHPWYATFLMATGRSKEALELTKARANEPSDTPWPLLTYAVFLYAARKFVEAEHVILTAKKEYDDTWLSHALWSCVSQARQKKAAPLLGMSIPQVLADGTVVYMGLCVLEILTQLSEDDADYSSVKQTLEGWVKNKLTLLESPANDSYFQPLAEPRVSPFHVAIGCMAMGDKQKAIDLLSQDLERDHPLMVWMHLWPLLDPLREDAQFTRLIGRMNLPSR